MGRQAERDYEEYSKTLFSVGKAYADRAYQMIGIIDPREEIQVAEVYDAFYGGEVCNRGVGQDGRFRSVV